MESFGKSVAKGAGYGALGMAAVTADAGNPLANAAAGAVIGAGVGAVNAIKNRKAQKAHSAKVAEVHAMRNKNLGRQFK